MQFVVLVLLSLSIGSAQSAFMTDAPISDRTAAPAPGPIQEVAPPPRSTPRPTLSAWPRIPADSCAQQRLVYQRMASGRQDIPGLMNSVTDADIVVVGEAHNHDEEFKYYKELIDSGTRRGLKTNCLFLEQDEKKLQSHLDLCNRNPKAVGRRFVVGADVRCPGSSSGLDTSVPDLTGYALSRGWKVFAVDDHSLIGNDSDPVAIRARNRFMQKRILDQYARHRCDFSVVMQGSGHINKEFAGADAMQTLLGKGLPSSRIKTLGLMTRDSHSFFNKNCASGFFGSQDFAHTVEPSLFGPSAPEFEGFRDYARDFNAFVWYNPK